jgi:ABC-type transporter Mla subunit MlaD
MIAAVQEQGLSAERFVEIARSQQNPEEQPEESVSQEELENFQEASSQIAQIQEDLQSQLQEAVRTEGLEVQRFNEIFAAVRQNPQLMEKVQQML